MTLLAGCRPLGADPLNCPKGPSVASVGHFRKLRYTRMQLDRRSSTFEHPGLGEER